MADLARVPARGQVWQHVDGPQYVVVTMAILEATMTPVVVYVQQGDGAFVHWVRPIENFLGRATVDETRNRFERVS